MTTLMCPQLVRHVTEHLAHIGCSVWEFLVFLNFYPERNVRGSLGTLYTHFSLFTISRHPCIMRLAWQSQWKAHRVPVASTAFYTYRERWKCDRSRKIKALQRLSRRHPKWKGFCALSECVLKFKSYCMWWRQNCCVGGA